MYWDRQQHRLVSRRRFLGAAGVGALGLGTATLVGCGGDNGGGSGSPSTATSAAATTPKRGGNLQILASATPPHFDPVLNSGAGVISVIVPTYGRLWKPKTGNGITPWDFTLEPDLATSLEQPDKTTYIYKLRQGVKWQNKPPLNGRPFTAEDVVYSIRRALDNPQSTIKEELAAVSSIRAIDANTLEVKSKEPFAPLNAKFGGSQIFIFPHEIVEQKGDLKEVAIGTGPYVLDNYTPNVSLEYSRNPDYYGVPKPYADKLTQYIISDASSREAAFTTGKLDAFSVPDRRAFDRLARAVSDVQSQSYDTVGHTFFFRADKSPFQDPRMRQAFALTIDYQGLLQAFTGGEGHLETVVPQPMKAWSLPPAQWGEGAKYHSKPDLAEAKKLMEAAGQGSGVEFNFYYSNIFAPSNYLESVLQAMAAGAEKVGIKMKLVSEEYAVYIQRVIGTSDYVGMAHMPMAVFNDPDEYVFTFIHPRGRRNGSHQSDSELNALIEKQRQEFNNDERKKILWEIEKRNLVQNYFMPLIGFKTYNVWQKRLQNYGASADLGPSWVENAWLQI